MRSPPSEPQKENPDSWSDEIGVEGIEALPKRVDRYSKAKKGALDTAQYMAARTKHQAMAAKVQGCGDYLLFRHFFTVDKVKLHAAHFCKKHLLCPLCAIRRGAKALAAYLARWETIRQQRPGLYPFLVTLTVKDGPDLAERFKHLHSSQRELWMRKHRVVVGLGLAALATEALAVPFLLEPGIVVLAFSFSALVGVVFGYFPARRAAHLDPIEALRHE